MKVFRNARDRFNRHPKRNRGLAVAALTVLLGIAVAAGSIATNAEFVDAHSGTISGQLGHVQLAPSGGTGADHGDIAFPNKLKPGEVQTVTLSYTNVGSLNQDVWVVFNPTALSALNNLGTYGEVHIASNGTEVFASKNLNDNDSPQHCGSFSPTGCWPVPGAIKLASNVAPGDGGTWSFSFGYADKLSNNPPTDVDWNPYPIAGQVTVHDADGSGNGLPYQIVGVQAGGHAPVYTNH